MDETGKEIQSSTCGHSGKPWRINDFLFCRVVNKEGIMNDF